MSAYLASLPKLLPDCTTQHRPYYYATLDKDEAQLLTDKYKLSQKPRYHDLNTCSIQFLFLTSLEAKKPSL